MNTRTRATGASVLIALGSLAVTLFLLASPAGADPSSQQSGDSEAINGSVSSGACLAVNDSTCSGSGVAVNDSVSSGDAVAINGSTASGCSLAANVSTASGGDCAPAPDHAATPDDDRGRKGRPAAAVTKAGVAKAGVAKPTAATGLAFTGSNNGPLTAVAIAALALGILLVTLGSDRRRPVPSS